MISYHYTLDLFSNIIITQNHIFAFSSLTKIQDQENMIDRNSEQAMFQYTESWFLANKLFGLTLKALLFNDWKSC